MPNWCENRVDIWCEDEDLITEFVKSFMPEGYLDFHLICPLGLGDGKNGKPNWDYNTAVGKWGTKWDLDKSYADYTTISDTNIHMSFETAWAPPHGIYRAINDWFMQRTFEYSITWFYDEPGMQFAGYLNNE